MAPLTPDQLRKRERVGEPSSGSCVAGAQPAARRRETDSLASSSVRITSTTRRAPARARSRRRRAPRTAQGSARERRTRGSPPGEQLEWEARRGPLAAGAAFVSAALIFASVSIQVSTDRGARGRARDAHPLRRARSDFILSLGLQVASYFLLTGALFYLFRATIFRRPEMPRFAVGLLLLRPVLLAVGARAQPARAERRGRRVRLDRR